MKPSITLLIVVVIILHSVLCYKHTNAHSLNGILDKKDKFFSNRDTDETVRQTEDIEQLLQPSPFTIVDVHRQVLGDNLNQFTVKYESTVTPVKTNWEYGAVLGELGTMDIKKNGMYETTARVTPPVMPNYHTKQGVVLTLSTPDEREHIALSIHNKQEDGVVTAIPVPRLDIEPMGDFVYEEGEDFTFKLRVQKSMDSVNHGNSVSMYSLWIKYFSLDLDTEDVVLHQLYAYGNSDLLKNEKYEDFQEFSMKLNTSVSRISGAVAVGFSVWNWWTDVIESVERTKNVILRPSTQAGPLPDGFLGFAKTQDEPEKLYCSLGNECRHRCVAVGSDITEMKVERLRSDGTVERLGDPYNRMDDIWDSLRPYVQEENFIFQVDSVPEVPEKFQCTAKNTEGKVITMEIPLFVHVPATIIEEDSSLEWDNDQNDATVLEFTSTCTVVGDPQPHVTFTVSTWYAYRNNVQPDEIVVTGDRTYKVILHESVGVHEFYRGGPLQVDCMANQTEGPIHSYDSYIMSVYPPF